MKIKGAIAVAVVLVASAAIADELHDKTVAADNNIKQAIQLMHAIGAQHGPEFGGHLGKAEALLQQADRERAAGMEYYRARHPGWQ